MIGEFDVAGIFMSPLLLCLVVAFSPGRYFRRRSCV